MRNGRTAASGKMGAMGPTKNGVGWKWKLIARKPRASGGAFVTWAGYTQETYEVIEGAPVQFNSSPGVTRGFCGTCGSPMTFESTRWPGEMHVGVGSLDQPGDFPPTAHVYAAERLPWLHLDEHLPSFAKTSDKGEA